MVDYLYNKANLIYKFNRGQYCVENQVNTNEVVTKVSNCSLTVYKIACNPYFKPDDLISYSIIIINNSDSVAKNVVVLEPLHQQTYVHNSAILYINGCPAQPCILKAGNVVSEGCNHKFGFKIGDLAANSTAIINFQTKPNPCACKICNRVAIYFGSGSNCQPRSQVCSNVTTVHKAYAQIEAAKTASKSNVECGDHLTYTIKLTNNGNVNATDGILTDQLPANFKVLPYGVKVNGCNHPYNLSSCNLLRVFNLNIPAHRQCNNHNYIYITVAGVIQANTSCELCENLEAESDCYNHQSAPQAQFSDNCTIDITQDDNIFEEPVHCDCN